MIRQGRGGRLIHIGSTAALLPAPQQGAYCVAKAGLRMLSKMAAMELVQYGITSNLLCPGGAVTDINRDVLSDPAVMSKLEGRIPAGRLAKVLIPMKVIADSDWIPVTSSEVKLIVFGAKRRWHSYPA
jgi:NAD(P)-dependent dehydrogenase (short-subunit alcohol dehydrogenase family)